MKTVTSNKSIGDLPINLYSSKKYSPAFEFYITKLNLGDRLPRGKYFRNRVAGNELIIINTVAGNKTVIVDECWVGINTKKSHE